jgi:ATP phosphoribosyltransferase
LWDTRRSAYNESERRAISKGRIRAVSERILRLAIPNGNLQQATFDLFCKAGYNMTVQPRSYYPAVDDREIQCMLVRPQEQPRYVQDGLIDAGFSGLDLIREAGAEVIEVLDAGSDKISAFSTRWVLVVPEGSSIQDVKDLEGKRIATELVNVTRSFLEDKGVQARVEYSYGATEVKPPLLADAIVDSTVTGTSLKANNLRVVATVIESTPRLIAGQQAMDDPWKRRKIEDLALMLAGALAAEGKVGLMLNVRRDDLDGVLAVLPALKRPTISSLSEADWVAINTVIDESVVREIVPKLKQAGGQGIVEYPLNKIIE